ncbi:MAG TPA: T9SS type A sorting domain-containing protein [Bacteroidia bacterium]|nr:T9SS type A sorting domain-containing protein [Bacteroidia bacterium]
MRTKNHPNYSLNIFKYWLMSILLIIGMLKNVNAVTYYSQAGGPVDLNTLAGWNTNRLGGGSTPANLTTAGNTFVIQGSGNGGTSPHLITNTAIVTFSGAGSKLQIENGASLTASFAITIGSTATFQVDNGGTYVHNNTVASPSTGIFGGTESFGATSNVRIDNWPNNTTVITTGVTLPFGHLELNYTANAAAWQQNWNGSINLTAGNFKITSVGTANIRFTASGTYTLTIGGNFIQNCTGTVVASNAAGAPTINIAGNFTISAGNFIASNGTGSSIINVTGNYSQTGGNLALVRDAGNSNMNVSGTCSLTGGSILLVTTAAGAGTGTFTVTGNTTLNVTGTDGVYLQNAGTGIGIFQTQDLIVPGTSTSTTIVDFGAGTIPNNEFRIKGTFSKGTGSGTFYTTSLTAAKGFVFNGTGTLLSPQILSYLGTSSDYVNYVVNTGTVVKLSTNVNNGPNNFSNPPSSFTVNGTLDCSTFRINGGGANCTFALNSGATLVSANSLGVISGTSGSVVNNITSTFNAAANYIFNGSVTQNTNFKTAGQTMANLTIDNSGGSTGVTLNSTATVNGTLTVTTGTFTISSALTMGGSAATTNNAAIVLTSGVTWDCAGTQVSGTGALTIDGTFVTSRTAGFNGSASTAVVNTISPLTINIGSTVDYSRATAQTITSANYSNLTNSGNGPRTFSSSGTIGIATSFSPGSGLYTIGTSTVNYNGATTISSFPVPSVSSGGNYYNLQVTGSPTYTMASSLTVGNDFTVNGSGTFRLSNGAPNTLNVNGNLNVQSGTLTGNSNNGTGLTIFNISGNFSQSGGTVNVNNATSGNGGTANLNTTGTFTLTGGNFNLISNTGGNVTVTVDGTVSVNAGGTDGINLESANGSGTAIFQANGNATFQGASSALVDFGFNSVSGNEFRIKGNFSKSGTGTFTTTSTSNTSATGFVFNGTGTLALPQTFSYAGSNSEHCSYQVNSGTAVQMLTGLVMGALANPYSVFTVIGTLDCGLNVISGGNAASGGGANTGFTLILGGTLATKNTGGVLATITDLKTTYSVAGNYLFNNTASAQNTAFKSNPQQMANLTISNPVGVSLTESATITGTLAFTAGIITTSTNFVTLNTGATVTGAGTGTYVNGNVLRIYPTSGNATLDFPIGSSSAYAPVTLAVNGIGGSGQVFVAGSTLTAPAPSEDTPITNSSGIDQTKKAGNYWTLVKSGTGSFTTYDASFTIANTANTGNPLNYIVRKYDPFTFTWSATTLGTQTSSVTQATGLTSFSEFEVGEANTISPATNPSHSTICDGNNTSFTSTSTSSPAPSILWYENTGSGYLPLSNGGVYSGVTTNTLVITGGTAAMDGYTYRAHYTNINGTTHSTQAFLNVNTVPANNAITGFSGTTEACTGEVFLMTVNATGPGLTYTWNTTTNPSVVLFSNSPGGPWSAGPFPTSGNTVYAQFGSVVGSGYNICAHAINSCGSNIANKCTFIRGKVGTPGNINGSIVACPGTSKAYGCGASAGASVYTWTLGGSTSPITSGQGNNTGVLVTYPAGFTSGQLCVTASLTCGTSSISAPRCITVSATPAVPGPFISAPSKVCPGQSNVLFSVPAVTNASGYNWTVPVGTTIVESPPYGTSIHVDFPSSYAGAPPVCAYANSSCASSAGRCKTVGSYVPGLPGSMAGPVNNACDTTVQYSVPNVSGATSYTWTIPGAATNFTGQGTNAIQFDLNSSFTSGTVSVTANTNLCVPGTSAPRTITINGKPATPGSITANPLSWCSGSPVNFSVVNPTGVPLPTYLWTVTNGTNMTGQGTNSISVTWGTTGVPSSGPVNVSASNTCGGSGTRSQTFSTSCREEEVLNDAGISVYPNPAHDKLTVSIYVKGQAQFQLYLHDMSGRMVLSENSEAMPGTNSYELDLNSFAKGVYMLEVQSEGNSHKTKVVIE